MTKEQLVQLLETKYGHIDYWSLAAKWKRIHHEQVADMIIGSFEAKSAAAPDLLAACEAVVVWANTPKSERRGQSGYFLDDILPQLDAAIAAAKVEK